ncbi:MAG: hypothetical protein JNL05_03500 [Flavobacteriales bacterium]|nr:hypothetical protein [Flavobacteriales bacterium]
MDDGEQEILERFPASLRALIDAELAAGNRILSIDMAHPAAPVGGRVMLAHDLLTRELPEGLRLHARYASSHHQEVTDAAGHCHVVTAPLPSLPEPDMDAIRRAHEPEAPPKEETHAPAWTVEPDIRGEELIYHEPERKASVRWTWSSGSRIATDSLGPWWYTEERREQAMTPEERALVLQRLEQRAQLLFGPTRMEP